MRIAAIAMTAALACSAALPAGAAVPGPARDNGILRVEDGCMPGWHVVPGHRLSYGEWVPTRCAPNDRGGNWTSPYPANPEPPGYVYLDPEPAPYWRPY